MKLNLEETALLEQLKDRFEAQGQDLKAHLHGLLNRKEINYWDYVRVDTLLSLQHPETPFPDEMVFIMYHQVNELIFKMILHEIRQIARAESLSAAWFTERAGRINRYYRVLIQSFSVMTFGMEVDQYLEFRMSLIPASGFQSCQYRKIELASTDAWNLRAKNPHASSFEDRQEKPEQLEIPQLYKKLYWQRAGLNPETGERTATLRQFEDRYREELLEWMEDWKEINLNQKFLSLPKTTRESPELIAALRQMDRAVNIEWPMVHMGVARRYLMSQGDPKEATGGSAWQKYLHPRYQRRIFFPSIWSEEELAHWAQEEPAVEKM